MKMTDTLHSNPQDKKINASSTNNNTLSDFVYHKLFRKISSGDLPQHARPPSENEIAQLYKVYRTIVRKALERLRNDGLISSQQCSRSFVRVGPTQQVIGFGAMGSITDIQRCYEFRISIEANSVFYAAQRANSVAIETIESTLSSLTEGADHDLYHDEKDYVFHNAIAQATNNRYYSEVLAATKEQVTVLMKVGGTCLMGPQPSIDKVIEGHQVIVNAIRRKRPILHFDLGSRSYDIIIAPDLFRTQNLIWIQSLPENAWRLSVKIWYPRSI